VKRLTTMRAAVLLLWVFVVSLPTCAQSRGGGIASSPSSLVNTGGGGGGGGYGSSGTVSFHTFPGDSPGHYDYSYAQGSDSEFVPSTYVPYEEAVKMGQAALAYKPKSIAQIAAEYRAAKKQSN
jgi:hypothetical protein